MIPLLATIALVWGAPDVDARSRAIRVQDVYLTAHNCSLACTATVDAERDTECLKAAISRGIVTARYNAVELPPGHCYINERIDLMDATGFEMYGHGAGGGGEARTMLYWDSATPADPVLYLGDMAYTYLHDFAVQPAFGRTITTAINIDNCDACFLPVQGAYVARTPTSVTLERIAIGAPSGGQDLINGIEVGGIDANNDFHVFSQVDVQAYQGYAYSLPNSQTKSVEFRQSTCLADPTAVTDTVCVHNGAGCFNWSGGGGGYNNDADFVVGSMGCGINIHDANFEGSLALLRDGGTTGAYGNILIQGTRWEANGMSALAAGADRRVISYGFAGSLVLINNVIGGAGDSDKPIALFFQGSNVGAAVTMIGNFVGGNLTPAEMFTSKLPSLASGNSVSPPAAAGAAWPMPFPIPVLHATLPAVSPGIVGPAGVIDINNGSAAITNLLGTYTADQDSTEEGAVVTLWCNGCTRTVEDSADIALVNDADFAMRGDDFLTLQLLDGVWRERGRSRAVAGAALDVTDFGALPDDAVDDTTALQAALDATCDGCELTFPEGVFTVSSGLTVADKSISIRGTSAPPMTLQASPFGDVVWSSDNEFGTVIETTMTTGSVLSIDGTFPRVEITNLAIKGKGDDTRTTVGFDLGGTSTPRLALKNVTALNLAIGFDVDNCQDGTLDGVAARGCDVGVRVGENSNSNVWTGIDLSRCNTQVLIEGAGQNYFVGGTIQNHENFGIRSLGGAENTFKNIYFESSIVGAKAISLEYDEGKGVILFTGEADDNRITWAEAHGRAINDIVQVRTVDGVLPSPLAASTDYYVKTVPSSTAMTLALTLGGAEIDLTTDGSGSLNMVWSGSPGNYNEVDRCHFGTTGDDIDVWTNTNTIDTTSAIGDVNFKHGTSANVLRGAAPVTLSDLGGGNWSETWTGGAHTYTATPAATAENGGLYQYVAGPKVGWGMDTTNWQALLELRDDVGYIRLLDVANNTAAMQWHLSAIPANRFAYTPNLMRFGATVQVDTVREETASAGVNVQFAEFTGTSAANSTLAISGITADDSGAVFMSLDGSGDEIIFQSSDITLNGTVDADGVTLAGGLVDGVDVSGHYAATSKTLLNRYYNLTTSTLVEETLLTYNIPAGTLVANGDRINIRIRGHHAVNTNSATMTPTVGGQWTGGITSASNSAIWIYDIEFFRTAVDAQRYSISGAMGSSGGASSGGATWALDDGAVIPLVIKATTPTLAGDFVLDHVSVTYTPAVL
jgi:hypothetical protein